MRTIQIHSIYYYGIFFTFFFCFYIHWILLAIYWTTYNDAIHNFIQTPVGFCVLPIVKIVTLNDNRLFCNRNWICRFQRLASLALFDKAIWIWNALSFAIQMWNVQHHINIECKWGGRGAMILLFMNAC